jgi:hypothetical protein
MSMAPGTYLRKRREAAGFTVPRVAAALAGAPDRIRPIRPRDFQLLEVVLEAVEADLLALTLPQAALLHRIFRFDLTTLELLMLHHGEVPISDLPLPQICRVCACTWHDACETEHGPCAWTPGDPTLCTSCRDPAALCAAAAPQGEPA